MSITTYHKKQQGGFTLLEVMIAAFVLAVGLLGIAGLQVTAIKSNHTAFTRGQTTQLAYDIADRMRANKDASGSYLTADPSTANAQASCLAAGCTPAQMAENDLYEWNLMLTSTLPGIEASIAQASDIFTVTITWDDNRDGAVDSDDPEFKVSFSL